jgi:hypothetical protein
MNLVVALIGSAKAVITFASTHLCACASACWEFCNLLQIETQPRNHERHLSTAAKPASTEGWIQMSVFYANHQAGSSVQVPLN